MAERRHTVLIVGASAAGLRCACRLARLRPDWRVRVAEARNTFSYAACGLPYLLSGDVVDAQALRRTVYGVTRDAEYFAGYKGVEVLTGHRVLSIDTERRTARVEGPGGESELRWDELVLATGARPRRLQGQPDHPRVVCFHTWDDVEPLRRELAEGRIDRVALVGAGLVGCELAEAFRDLWGAEVVLLEATGAPLPQVLDPEVGKCVARHLRDHGVELRLDSPPQRIEVVDERVVLAVAGGAVEADVAVVAVGVQPAVELARGAGIELGAGGAIAVDERLAASAPHVWAVGDCAEVHHAVLGEPAYLPLGSLANRQGRTLANILAGRRDRFPPVVGAIAVKVFEYNVAATGCTETTARQREIDARAVWISADDRAHYWPETKAIKIKLVYETGTRRILGVQAVGEGDVIKRVDAATQWIASRATLDDLAHLEHAYAPPYAPAMEPLAVAAQVAQNQEDGVEAAAPDSAFNDVRILDVRLAEESRARPVLADGTTHIGLGELTSRLDEIDRSTGLVVCERGSRSAEAVRFLQRHGLRARYLGGGLRWRALATPGGGS
jgi:NADPH-dependent 2,4-dienoyl-CoA reductase/sulfur reductase-like enzyme/rhodanese-related sulfurtransferase